VSAKGWWAPLAFSLIAIAVFSRGGSTIGHGPSREEVAIL
jgi:hypothetical protein